MNRLILTAAAFVTTMVLVTMAAILGVLFFAGPHSEIVSESMKWLVLLAAWAAVIFLTALAARHVWMRMRKSG